MFTIVLRSISQKKATRGKRQEMKQASPYSWIATAVVAVATVWFALGIFPIFPTAIVSNSMKPNISRGDIVLIQKIDPNTLKEQDVILYSLDNIQVFHRIIKIQYAQGVKQYTVKGDNNQYPDPKPVLGEQIIGKHIATIPYIGWPVCCCNKVAAMFRWRRGVPSRRFWINLLRNILRVKPRNRMGMTKEIEVTICIH
jgi:signal peptidase